MHVENRSDDVLCPECNERMRKDKLDDTWQRKIERNMERDRATDRKLRSAGWRLLHLWGGDINKKPDRAVRKILRRRQQLLQRAD